MLDSLTPLQRRNYFLLLITAGCYFSGLSFLLLLPKYLRGLGASEEQLGWLVGTPLLPFILIAPLAGALADRVSARRLTVLGLAIGGAANGLFLMVEEVGPLAYGLRLLGGAGHALVFTCLFAMVARSLSSEHKGQGIAYLTVVIQGGNILGSFIGALVLEQLGGTPFFLLSGLLVLAAAGLVATVRVEAPVAAPGGTALREIWRRPVLSGLVLILVLGGAFGTVLQFVPTYLDWLYEAGQVGAPIASSYFLTSALLTVAGVRVLFGGRVYRAGGERWQSACMLALPVAVLLLQYIQGPLSSVLVSVAFGASYGLLFPAVNALVLVRMGEARQGQASGLLSMVYEVGFRGFGFIMGPLAQYVGYSSMFQVLASICVAGGIGFFVLEQERRRWLAAPVSAD